MKAAVIIAIFGVAWAKDYYWRPFDGTIPKDAIVGTDDGSVKTYIGNVYVYDVGRLIGPLVAGIPNITVTGGIEYFGDIYVRDNYIKILCSRHPDKFQWIRTNRTSLTTLDYKFVLGGQQSEAEGRLYIGRIDYQGLRIGKIDGYFNYIVDIYFAYDGEELSSISDDHTVFEVLTYVD